MNLIEEEQVGEEMVASCRLARAAVPLQYNALAPSCIPHHLYGSTAIRKKERASIKSKVDGENSIEDTFNPSNLFLSCLICTLRDSIDVRLFQR